MRPELSALLIPGVAATEYLGDHTPDPLFAEEEAAVEKAVDKRKLEFALGRKAARAALSALGVAPLPLLQLADRSVQWPDGFVGSITHAEGYVGALAAKTQLVKGIGIDAERKTRVQDRLWKQIANAEEMAWFEAADDETERRLRATRLFSAKEAFYKAQYCLSRAWVGFHDVTVRFSELGFEVELELDVARLGLRGQRYQGNQAVLGDHVISVLTIAATP